MDEISINKVVNSRRYWIQWLLAAFLVVTALAGHLLYSRIQSCIAYNKFVAHKNVAINLAIRPRDIEIEKSDDVSALKLGYAETTLPADWAKTISSKLQSVIVRSESDESVVFMPPGFESTFSPDGDYSWTVKSAFARQLTLNEVFWMSSAEFKTAVASSIPKAFDSTNQNGIRLFETKDVRGIIRLGSPDKPGHLIVQVWSSHGSISQGIQISAASPEKALRLAQCVLFGLRYSVDHVPPREEVENLIQQALPENNLISIPPDRR